MQTYGSVPSRNLIMAERDMLKHAEPIKTLSTFGTQKPLPKNKTDTVRTLLSRPITNKADVSMSTAATLSCLNHLNLSTLS